jgi:hypothetical protein
MTRDQMKLMQTFGFWCARGLQPTSSGMMGLARIAE